MRSCRRKRRNGVLESWVERECVCVPVCTYTHALEVEVWDEAREAGRSQGTQRQAINVC